MITDGEGKTLYSRDLDRGIAVEGTEIARRLGPHSDLIMSWLPLLHLYHAQPWTRHCDC